MCCLNLVRLYLEARYRVGPRLLAQNHSMLCQVGIGVLRTRLNPDHALEDGTGAVSQNPPRQNMPGCMRRLMSQVRDHVKPLLSRAENYLHILGGRSLPAENTVHPRPCNASPNMAHRPVHPRVPAGYRPPIHQGVDIVLEVLEASKVHLCRLAKIDFSHFAVKRRP